MKKIIIWMLGIGLSGVYSACSEKKTQEVITYEVDVDKQYPPCFNEYFELEEMIRLETTDSSVLGDIFKVVAVDDHLFISTRKSQYLYVFKRDGKFVRVINHQGRGPEEYTRITDFMVNQSPREIIIYDWMGKLNFYDWEGNFLRTQKMRKYLSHIEQLPDGGWLVDQGLAPVDSLRFIYQALTPDMKFMKGIEKLPELKYNVLLTLPSSIFKNDGKYFVIPLTSNTIYEYDWKDTLFIPCYKFLIRGYPVTVAGEITDELMRKRILQQYYLMYSEFIGEKTVVAKAMLLKNGRAHLFLIDKQKNDIRKMECKDKDNELPIQRGDMQQTGFDGKLLFYVMASSVVEGHYDDENSVGYKLSQEINEEDNPVLLLYREK